MSFTACVVVAMELLLHSVFDSIAMVPTLEL
jgi:hypothetical protein